MTEGGPFAGRLFYSYSGYVSLCEFEKDEMQKEIEKTYQQLEDTEAEKTDLENEYWKMVVELSTEYEKVFDSMQEARAEGLLRFEKSIRFLDEIKQLKGTIQRLKTSELNLEDVEESACDERYHR